MNLDYNEDVPRELIPSSPGAGINGDLLHVQTAVSVVIPHLTSALLRGALEPGRTACGLTRMHCQV